MFPLYIVTDPCLIAPRITLTETVEQAIAGGARLIQYRDKTSSRRALYEQAKAIRSITTQYDVTLIINDHVDLALAVSAEGVHLGQEDMPIGIARKILGKGAIIGQSTHTVEEAIQAASEGADYIGFGPIFATQTKTNAKMPVGIEALIAVKRAVQSPVYAIGGIGLSHLPAIFSAGASGVAVISGLAGDIQSNVRKWVKAIHPLRVV